MPVQEKKSLETYRMPLVYRESPRNPERGMHVGPMLRCENTHPRILREQGFDINQMPRSDRYLLQIVATLNPRRLTE